MTRPPRQIATTARAGAPTAPAVTSLADAAPVLLWSLNAVAKALSTSRRQIEYLRAAGQFPPPDARIGRSPRWRPATIDAWINAGGTP